MPSAESRRLFIPRLTRIQPSVPAMEPFCTRSQASPSSGVPKPIGPWKCSCRRMRLRLNAAGAPSPPSATCWISVSPTLTGRSTRKNAMEQDTLGNRLRLKPVPWAARTSLRTSSSERPSSRSSCASASKRGGIGWSRSASRSTSCGIITITLWPLPRSSTKPSPSRKSKMSAVASSREVTKDLCTIGKW
ncbi:hypothetical protein D3C80_1118250 [compost metagenome]